MVLTKDHYIEGKIIKKGTELNIKESNEYSNIDEVVSWLLSLKLPARTPSGVDKVDFKILKELVALAYEYQSAIETSSNLATEDLIKEEFSFKILGKIKHIRMSKEEITNIFSTNNKKESDVIKKKYATYYRRSSIAYSSFLKLIDDLEDFFSTLNSPHSKVLKDLNIHFVDAKDLNSIANYSGSYDLLRINPKRVGNTKEEYGSMRYVILHELGHRYLRIKPQRWDYDNNRWITTKYSEVDSFSGEEKFAELFALSHWERKYPEFKSKIEEFLNILD